MRAHTERVCSLLLSGNAFTIERQVLLSLLPNGDLTQWYIEIYMEDLTGITEEMVRAVLETLRAGLGGDHVPYIPAFTVDPR